MAQLSSLAVRGAVVACWPPLATTVVTSEPLALGAVAAVAVVVVITATSSLSVSGLKPGMWRENSSYTAACTDGTCPT